MKGRFENMKMLYLGRRTVEEEIFRNIICRMWLEELLPCVTSPCQRAHPYTQTYYVLLNELCFPRVVVFLNNICLFMTNFQIGDKVIDEAGYLGMDSEFSMTKIGTVAYIGPICLSKPSIEWIGVVWDKEGRGKNNGTLQDKDGIHRYFSCPDQQGSFVRGEKLCRCYTVKEAYTRKSKMVG